MKHIFNAGRGSFAFLLIFLLMILFLLWSCSQHESVRHLERKAWNPETKQQLKMKYLTFDYFSRSSENKIEIQGTAQPREDALPSWASWSKEIWLGAYLCDQEGQVLAQDVKVFSPRDIRDQAIEFQFELHPQHLGSPGAVYITYGYRLVLTRDPETDLDPELKKQVFFASESALSRF